MNKTSSSACTECLRRSLAVALLAGRVEHQRHRQKLRQILALETSKLIESLVAEDGRSQLQDSITLQVKKVRERCAAQGIRTYCQHRANFPIGFHELADAPAVFYHLGAYSLASLVQQRTAVALVGARRATAYGFEVAHKLASQLASANITVVSGMALGIDAAAHQGAIDGGGTTLAVLASGVDTPYPASKRQLYKQILRHGAVVSEFPPGFRPHKWCFPARNRCIAALSACTVVVEACEKSGSLITADFAAQLGKGVASVPGPINSLQSFGTNTLLFDGAYLVRDAQDIVDALFGVGHLMLEEQEKHQLSQELQLILSHISFEGETASSLEQKFVRQPVPELARKLSQLEIDGYLRRDFQGRYVKR